MTGGVRYVRSGSPLLGWICVSKSIWLGYSCNEIYVSNLEKGFTETHLEDVDRSKTSNASTLSLWIEEI